MELSMAFPYSRIQRFSKTRGTSASIRTCDGILLAPSLPQPVIQHFSSGLSKGRRKLQSGRQASPTLLPRVAGFASFSKAMSLLPFLGFPKFLCEMISATSMSCSTIGLRNYSRKWAPILGGQQQ